MISELSFISRCQRIAHYLPGICMKDDNYRSKSCSVDRRKLAEAACEAMDGRMSHPRARNLVDTMLNELVEGIASDGEAKLHRFGKFVVHDKVARAGRNPRTGEPHTITARKTVSFQAAQEFRQAVNTDGGLTTTRRK